MTDLDFNAHLARESARFAAALDAAKPDAPVPPCPDWDADDLLWHLAKVQAFWATIVEERITDADKAGSFEASRPTERAELRAYFERSTQELQSALADADDDVSAWTWSSDQSVGFIRRRQAHEALIHRVDAEVTAGARTPMDPNLCADGVDEVLRVMYGGAPPWGAFVADEARMVRLEATDTGDSWSVVLGRFTGTDPDDTTPVDEADFRVMDESSAEAAATISGTAADLDCWLWHRPVADEPASTGDAEVLAAFNSILAHPIN